MGLLRRASQQYHWEDEGYGSFEGFLAALSSRKRKTIRRERADAQGFGGDILCLTGDAIEPRHWAAMWAFYQDTGARKWGQPYLTRPSRHRGARAQGRRSPRPRAAGRAGPWRGP
jgi:predicted N-acyltransferase